MKPDGYVLKDRVLSVSEGEQVWWKITQKTRNVEGRYSTIDGKGLRGRRCVHKWSVGGRVDMVSVARCIHQTGEKDRPNRESRLMTRVKGYGATSGLSETTWVRCGVAPGEVLRPIPVDGSGEERDPRRGRVLRRVPRLVSGQRRPRMSTSTHDVVDVPKRVLRLFPERETLWTQICKHRRDGWGTEEDGSFRQIADLPLLSPFGGEIVTDSLNLEIFHLGLFLFNFKKH